MESLHRTFATLRRCKKRAWKRIRKLCVFSCYHRTLDEDSVLDIPVSAAESFETTMNPTIATKNEAELGLSKVANIASAKPTTINVGTMVTIVNTNNVDTMVKKERNTTEEKKKTSIAIQTTLPKNTIEVENSTNSNDNKPSTKYNENVRSSELPTGNSSEKPTIIKSYNSEGRKVYLPKNRDIQLNKAENAWVPRVTKKKPVATDAEQKTTEEVDKIIRSILNKITAENAVTLIQQFLTLPINTMERLKNAVDLVYERAIREKFFVSVYATLCSGIQTIKVTSDKVTTTFISLIINKLQNAFKKDETECTKNRSQGHFRFIGELYKVRIITLRIVQQCVINLMGQSSDDSIRCLCDLLNTTGRELERRWTLNDIFRKLQNLTSAKNISPRTRSIIYDLMDLRKNRWIPKSVKCEPVVKNDVNALRSSNRDYIDFYIDVKLRGETFFRSTQ